MICLTGDVHHMSLKAQDQPFLKSSEMDAACHMLEIADSFGIKVTLFMTGKLFIEEKSKLDRLLSFKNLEIGGHNYFAFKPRLPFKVFKHMGIRNGPYSFQSWEVKKTVQTLNSVTPSPIVSWRNHGYRHDKNTLDILAKHGIRYCSDLIDPDRFTPFYQKGIVMVPINVLPDHDYIYHGSLTKETVNNTFLKNTPFKTEAMSIDKWLERVLLQVKHIIDNNGIATILTHPACMEITDDFQVFTQLCKFLSNYKSFFMKEIPPAN
jgi:hypothetical protein